MGTDARYAADVDADAPMRWPAWRYCLAALVVSVSLVGFGGYWAASATLAGAVIAKGELRVEGERKTVKHPEGGVVEEILVSEGESVAAGQVLLRLDKTELAAELAVIENQLDEAHARAARLEAESRGAEIMEPNAAAEAWIAARPDARRAMEAQRALFAARRDIQAKKLAQISERVVQARSEIGGKEQQIAALGRQREIAASELADLEPMLRRGLAQRSAVSGLQREVARFDGQLGELQAETARSEGQISELELQALEVAGDYRERAIGEHREAAAKLAELSERRVALAASIDRVDIRAPAAGLVLDLAVHSEGAVVSPAEPILYLVPTDQRLVVSARIDTGNRDQLRLRQAVTVLFPGFNQRTTPSLEGVVVGIGGDTLTEERDGSAYYPVEISLSEDELARLSAAISVDLAPGMPVEVHIQTGERSAASYFLKPIEDVIRRAFRETD